MAELFFQLVETTFSLPVNPKLVGNINFEPVRKYRPKFESVLKRFDITSNLSHPSKVFDFDFQNYYPLPTNEHSFLYPYSDGLFDFVKLNISVIKNGMLHGATFWFNAYLDPDKSIQISNSPASNTHWSPLLWIFDYDLEVVEGTVLKIELARIAERFIIAVDNNITEMRLVIVNSNCDTAMDVFTSPDLSIKKTRMDFKFSFSRSNEYNILAAPIGHTIRTIIESNKTNNGNRNFNRNNRNGKTTRDYLITRDEDLNRDIRVFNINC